MGKKYSFEILEDWLVEYYIFEYKELDLDFKKALIHYVIHNNAEIFDDDYVQERYEFCAQCGVCCINQGYCDNFDEETRKCKSHNNQRSFLCKIYPRPGEYGLSLTINCKYVLRIFIEYLDKAFEFEIERRNKNG